jgi:hypothetical protein
MGVLEGTSEDVAEITVALGLGVGDVDWISEDDTASGEELEAGAAMLEAASELRLATNVLD